MNKNALKKISANFPIEYFTDENNIPNQNLVKQTIEYFENGPGARAYTPIEFLNLLEKQYQFIVENIGDSDFVLKELDKLKLDPLHKHILFGLLLKWFGGYPVNNFNEVFQIVLKEIEKRFLAFDEITPEKEFCKVNGKQTATLKKIEIALNASLASGIDVQEILKGMNKEIKIGQPYRNFEELFQDSINNGLLPVIENRQLYLIEMSRHQFEFNVWLQNVKSLNYGDECQYYSLLTKENFNSYLQNAYNESQILSLVSITSESAYRVYQENYNRLRNRFRVKRTVNESDYISLPQLKPGDIIEFEPEYKSTIEAFTLLTEYYAKAYFELEKYFFLSTYKVMNDATAVAELEEMNKFIKEANEISLNEACKAYGSFLKDSDLFVYKRFQGGFYENLEISNYPRICYVGNIEARIYGRYFLFYNFLKEQVKKQNPLSVANDVEQEVQSNNENNFIYATIEDWIFMFKESMSENDYNYLVASLFHYFVNGSFEDTSSIIRVGGKVNKKLFGWNLNQLYRDLRPGPLSKEYLGFAKKHISLFANVDFDENNILKSNLYKYFTTKTK